MHSVFDIKSLEKRVSVLEDKHANINPDEYSYIHEIVGEKQTLENQYSAGYLPLLTIYNDGEKTNPDNLCFWQDGVELPFIGKTFNFSGEILLESLHYSTFHLPQTGALPPIPTHVVILINGVITSAEANLAPYSNYYITQNDIIFTSPTKVKDTDSISILGFIANDSWFASQENNDWYNKSNPSCFTKHFEGKKLENIEQNVLENSFFWTAHNCSLSLLPCWLKEPQLRTAYKLTHNENSYEREFCSVTPQHAQLNWDYGLGGGILSLSVDDEPRTNGFLIEDIDEYMMTYDISLKGSTVTSEKREAIWLNAAQKSKLMSILDS